MQTLCCGDGTECRLLQEVERKFGKFGEVREARIVRNPHNGESRGFGFVAMERDEDVDRVRPRAFSLFELM